jgi:hypothetical protein
MVRTLLIILLLIMGLKARAQFLGFGGDNLGYKSKIPQQIDKLKSLDIKTGPEFEEAFNAGIKNIENSVEEEKLYCSGEATNSEGKTLVASKRQLCMRELKKRYLDAVSTIFEVKRGYLDKIHTRQMEKLGEAHNRLKTTIESSF